MVLSATGWILFQPKAGIFDFLDGGNLSDYHAESLI
jgi:hypothetical protein